MENRRLKEISPEEMLLGEVNSCIRAYAATIHALLNTFTNQEKIAFEQKERIRKEIEKQIAIENKLWQKSLSFKEAMALLAEVLKLEKYLSNMMQIYHEVYLKISLEEHRLLEEHEKATKSLLESIARSIELNKNKLAELNATITQITADLTKIRQIIANREEKIAALDVAIKIGEEDLARREKIISEEKIFLEKARNELIKLTEDGLRLENSIENRVKNIARLDEHIQQLQVIISHEEHKIHKLENENNILFIEQQELNQKRQKLTRDMIPSLDKRFTLNLSIAQDEDDHFKKLIHEGIHIIEVAHNQIRDTILQKINNTTDQINELILETLITDTVKSTLRGQLDHVCKSETSLDSEEIGQVINKVASSEYFVKESNVFSQEIQRDIRKNVLMDINSNSIEINLKKDSQQANEKDLSTCMQHIETIQPELAKNIGEREQEKIAMQSDIANLNANKIEITEKQEEITKHGTTIETETREHEKGLSLVSEQRKSKLEEINNLKTNKSTEFQMNETLANVQKETVCVKSDIQNLQSTLQKTQILREKMRAKKTENAMNSHSLFKSSYKGVTNSLVSTRPQTETQILENSPNAINDTEFSSKTHHQLDSSKEVVGYKSRRSNNSTTDSTNPRKPDNQNSDEPTFESTHLRPK